MSYSRDRGWDDQRLATSNRVTGARVNRVELDVLIATQDGHDTVEAAIAATGLTKGQVEHARGVLVEQRLIEPAEQPR
jgi:hypothetical protein